MSAFVINFFRASSCVFNRLYSIVFLACRVVFIVCAVFFMSIFACFVVTNVLFSSMFCLFLFVRMMIRSIRRWVVRSILFVFFCCVVCSGDIRCFERDNNENKCERCRNKSNLDVIPADVFRMRTKRIGSCVAPRWFFVHECDRVPRILYFSFGKKHFDMHRP